MHPMHAERRLRVQGLGVRVQGVRRGAFCDEHRRESETVARCATLGRSQYFCKGSRFTVEGERCAVSSRSHSKRLKANDEEKERWLRVQELGVRAEDVADKPREENNAYPDRRRSHDRRAPCGGTSLIRN